MGHYVKFLKEYISSGYKYAIKLKPANTGYDLFAKNEEECKALIRDSCRRYEDVEQVQVDYISEIIKFEESYDGEKDEYTYEMEQVGEYVSPSFCYWMYG